MPTMPTANAIAATTCQALEMRYIVMRLLLFLPLPFWVASQLPLHRPIHPDDADKDSKGPRDGPCRAHRSCHLALIPLGIGSGEGSDTDRLGQDRPQAGSVAEALVVRVERF
jgi:hypothetical protein